MDPRILPYLGLLGPLKEIVGGYITEELAEKAIQHRIKYYINAKNLYIDPNLKCRQYYVITKTILNCFTNEFYRNYPQLYLG